MLLKVLRAPTPRDATEWFGRAFSPLHHHSPLSMTDVVADSASTSSDVAVKSSDASTPSDGAPVRAEAELNLTAALDAFCRDFRSFIDQTHIIEPNGVHEIVYQRSCGGFFQFNFFVVVCFSTQCGIWSSTPLNRC